MVLIYSKWGEIETVDHIRGKKYVQRFEDNLSVIKKPKITKTKAKPYTKVTWYPDYKRFGVKNISDVMLKIFKKRAYDISAITEKKVTVKFNGKVIPVKNFENYVDMYIGSKKERFRVYERLGPRWEIAVTTTPTREFAHASFVNGISTTKGGKHVDYILNMLSKKVVAYIHKKKKIMVRTNAIKEQVMIFINCVIENPATILFSSVLYLFRI